MAKVKLNLHNIKDVDLIVYGRVIFDRMNGNPDFPSPNPPLSELNTAVLELETAYDESRGGERIKYSLLRIKSEEVKGILRLLAFYVDNVSEGDELKIMRSGFQLKKHPEHVGLLPHPENVHLTNGVNSGQVYVKFKRVNNARGYMIQYLEYNPHSKSSITEESSLELVLPTDLEKLDWRIADTCTRTKYLLKGLLPGFRVLVRVASLSTKGRGGWSDPKPLIVP